MLHLEPKHFSLIKDAVVKEAYFKGFLKKGTTRQLITIGKMGGLNTLRPTLLPFLIACVFGSKKEREREKIGKGGGHFNIYGM